MYAFGLTMFQDVVKSGDFEALTLSPAHQFIIRPKSIR